jgi:hypothetical protein
MKPLLDKWVEPVLLSALSFFMPIKGLLALTGLLIALDFITGIVAAKKRGETIQSSRMKHTAVKCFTYQMAILTGFIIEQKFIPELPVVRLVSAVIGMTELKSILENLESLSGVSFVSLITEKLGGELRDKTERASGRKSRTKRKKR